MPSGENVQPRLLSRAQWEAVETAKGGYVVILATDAGSENRQSARRRTPTGSAATTDSRPRTFALGHPTFAMSTSSLRRWSLIGLIVLALGSVGLSAHSFFASALRARSAYGSLTESQRAHAAVGAAGLQTATWDFVRAHVTAHDRYLIETPSELGPGFHRFMRTFAGYWLLPSVAVSRRSAADLLVYIRQYGPRGSACRTVPELVCVVRVA